MSVDTAKVCDVAIDPERQERAHEYARVGRRMLVVDLVASAVVVVAFLVSGASLGLKDWFTSAGVTSPWALVAVYIGSVYVGYTVLFWPLAWWDGFVLQHRFGLSTQTLGGWFMDQLKSLGLGLVFGVAAGEVVYWLLRSYPITWWVWAAVFLVAASVLLDFVSPVLLVPLFYKLTPLDDPALVERIRALAERSGRHIAGVYTIDLSSRTTAANALFMGLGRTKRIALGDTLYAQYKPEEIVGIVAHELGHQVHHDIATGLLVQSALLLGALYVAQLFLTWGVGVFGFQGLGDVAALPLLVLAAGIFSLVTMPLSNAYSRWAEARADDFSLRATGEPGAYACAMTRLANQNLAELNPPRWAVWLLYTHPPMGERIAKAEQAAGG